MKKLIILFFSFSLLSGCIIEDDTPVETEEGTEIETGDDIILDTIDITNADEVTSVLEVSGAEVKTGTPPSPTNDGVQLDVRDEQEQDVIAGNPFKLSLAGEISDIDGVFFQVEGADTYLDIPITSEAFRLAKAATNQYDEIDISITVPATITSGTFCASYCVYTYDEERGYSVGNIIRICITVSIRGATEESDFLLNKNWKYAYTYQKIDGEIEYQFPEYENTEADGCYDDEEEKEVELTTKGELDYLLQFYENGNYYIELEDNYTEEYIAYDSTLESYSYTETNYYNLSAEDFKKEVEEIVAELEDDDYEKRYNVYYSNLTVNSATIHYSYYSKDYKCDEILTRDVEDFDTFEDLWSLSNDTLLLTFADDEAGEDVYVQEYKFIKHSESHFSLSLEYDDDEYFEFFEIHFYEEGTTMPTPDDEPQASARLSHNKSTKSKRMPFFLK